VGGLAQIIEQKQASEQQEKGCELKPVSREQELPLSYAQQRMWFMEQMNPNGSSYNVPRAIRIEGRLDFKALQQSINEIVARHEVLRTSFVTVDGQPRQVISHGKPVEIALIDVSETAECRREEEAMRVVRKLAGQPFDLSAGEVIRASLVSKSDREQILLLSMHHIASDGWSGGILFREMGRLYEAYSEGKESPLEPLAIQYADYAVWQREWMQGEVLDEQLGYWKRKLEGAPRVLELPTDRPRPAVQSFKGARHSLSLSSSLSQQLKELSQRQGVTLFMTLLAAFQVLLSRYSRQDDIVVGTDVANRNRIETEGLIGFFVNLLVLRTDLSGNPRFIEAIKRVKEVALGAYEHQGLPFEKLVEELRPERDLSRNPLVQVLFVMQNAPQEALELPGLTLSDFEINGGVSRFDLALFMTETEQGLKGSWMYSTDLFDATTLARMSGHLETLLGNIVAQPDARLSDLDILTDAERTDGMIEKKERQQSLVKRLKSVRRKAVDLSQMSGVKTEYLRSGETLPLVISPDANDIDLAEWAGTNREFISTELLKHGALLFRGFGLSSESELEKFALATCPELFGEYGDLPREGMGGKVYGSTPYPADQAILFHNESSHMHHWPMKIWFFCVKAAEQGGETPIVDCRKIYNLIDPSIRERFTRKRLMYVRNYTEGFDVSWQTFFRTADRSQVEDYCRKASIGYEWKDGDGLRTRQICPAVVKHPQTGEMSFFNQIQLHHVACLDRSVRESLLSMLKEEDLPRNVYYGDGSRIEESVVREISELYQKTAVSFSWQEGDVLMINNMMVAHGRSPYVGSRKIVVAMGEMVTKESA
jgi:alpha-ketoglutarate-dependent taurine dioxygenase